MDTLPTFGVSGQGESQPQERPRYWPLAIWTLTGMFSLGAILYSLLLRSQLPQGDPDDHRELVVPVLQWFSWGCGSSLAGLLFMVRTEWLLFSRLKPHEGRTAGWRCLRWGLALLHMTPWFVVLVALVTHL